MDLYLRPSLLETLLAGLPAFVFSLRTGDLSLLSASDGVCAVTGFEARDLLAEPSLLAARIDDADRGRVARLLGALATAEVLDEEIRLRCADGRVRWLRLRATPAPGPPGDPRAIAGIAWANDELRTARRKALQRLSILQASGATIFFADARGTIRLWNGACERFLGWSRADVTGGPMHAVFALPGAAVDGMIRAVGEEGTVSRETRFATRSGEAVDGIVTLSVVRDEGGRAAGMVGHIAGTAERRGLESRLEELVTRLRTIERVNRIIASEWDIGKTHAKIAAELEKLLDFDRTSIAVFEDGTGEVLVRAQAKGQTELGSGGLLPAEGSAPGWVQARRMTRIDEDMAAVEDRFVEDPILLKEGMRSRLMVPLFVGDAVVGTLNFNSRKKGAYGLDTVEGLGSIPEQLGLAIEKYRIYTRLRSSEERYRRLFEQGPPAAVIGRDGRFLDVNEGCLRLYGYDREEFLSLPAATLAVERGEAPHHGVVLRTGKPLEAEVLRRRRDGSVFWGWLNVFPVSENLLLEQIIDVTPRKEAEEALRREKDFSSSILSVANALIVVLDGEGRILLFNRKCEEVTGWTEADVRGRFLWDGLIPERFIDRLREIFAGPDEGEVRSAFEMPWRTREGAERAVIWNTSVVRDDGGRRLWVIGAGIDITEQRELEDRLRQAQKMEAIGTLAGGIAHDFNNIIQTIMGYAALMKGGDPSAAPPPEQIEAIEQAGLRAAELTTQLLGFARGGRYEVRPTNLNTVVDKVVSMIRHTFDRSIAIRTILAPDLEAVEGDGGQLEHTLLNLCINARDAMPDGGVLLIETRNEPLSAEERRRIAEASGSPHGAPPEGYISLSVSDTGVGISARDLPRIFEPFFTTKGPGKGSGMGLAMAYGIVKNHGGVVDVRSVPGTGTTFRVLLPATGRPALPAPAPDAAAPPAGGRETLLFVDDEESLRILTVEALGRLGYTVLTARNGVEAVDLFAARRGEIDLIILDMIMPGMGGEEALRRILAIDPGARVLLSSGYAAEGTPATLLEAGAAGFLKKPYRLSTMAAAVRKALGG